MIPRSLRMMEGFGIHSFRLVNTQGVSTFVKFHWRPKLGLQSTVWDETVKIAHEMTNAKPDDTRAQFIYDQAIREKQIDPSLAIPIDRIDWMQELFVKAGVVPKTVPTTSLIDTSVRDDADGLAGR